MGNCKSCCDLPPSPRSPPPQVRDPSLFRLKLGSVIQFRDLALVSHEAPVSPWASVHAGFYYGLPVLIKQLHRSDADVVQCFNCAVRLLVTLDHPNIVDFVGASLDAGPSIYMVTERLERGDLASILASNEEVSMQTSVSIMLDAARGMQYLLTLRPPVLHRNLHAGNVHVSADWRAKIANFELYQTNAPSSPIETGFESQRGDAELDEQAAVFSFYRVMLHIIHREEPTSAFTEDNERRVDAAWPKALMELVDECGRRESAERPSFAHIVDELGRISIRMEMTLLDSAIVT
ncbi:protein kinase [Achlya hypogyna]|uniref:Protein kinase n=1 Tax=Achlya hypogyna TaxID=1202772 RepID=A0A1V9YZZ6_ACHHY|nr:protein kinase [Achlya hypogyna]